jgi:hypothetical protein
VRSAVASRSAGPVGQAVCCQAPLSVASRASRTKEFEPQCRRVVSHRAWSRTARRLVVVTNRPRSRRLVVEPPSSRTAPAPGVSDRSAAPSSRLAVRVDRSAVTVRPAGTGGAATVTARGQSWSGHPGFPVTNGNASPRLKKIEQLVKPFEEAR